MWKMISLSVVVGIAVYAAYQKYQKDQAVVWLEINSLKYGPDERMISYALEN